VQAPEAGTVSKNVPMPRINRRHAIGDAVAQAAWRGIE